MRVLLFSLVFLLGLTQQVSGQLNDYKYIIVPKKFESFRLVNQHNTSTITKFLFTKKGFNAVYDDDLPVELSINRCLGLVLNMESDPSLFKTKVTYVLKDCKGREVFRSEQGSSKIKDYGNAYREAIRGAFISFEVMQYVYTGGANAKKDKKAVAKASQDKKPTTRVVEPEIAAEKEVVVEGVQELPEPKESKDVTSDASLKNTQKLLYAQPIDNGFQLVDKSPKVILVLTRSATPDVYLARNDSQSGVVYKKDGRWLFEHFDNGEVKIEELFIKF